MILTERDSLRNQKKRGGFRHVPEKEVPSCTSILTDA